MTRLAMAAWFCISSMVLLGACSDGSDGSSAAVGPTDTEQLDSCNLPPGDIPVSVTASGIEYVRTPDACFESLVNFPYAPNYMDVDGMQMHYIDEGPRDGEVVLMLHGQPSWSYLYRKMIPVLVDAGYRVIAADHIGMGRSDKPVDPRVHTYDQQVAWNTAFITQLGVQDITLFVQDWGSLIGLRIAGEMPDRFARIVIANGDLPPLPPGLNPFMVPVFEFDESVPEAPEFFAGRSSERVEGFQQWIEFAASTTHLFAADVVQIGSATELPGNELSAYDAPFPDPIYWGAIRAFPSMIAGISGQTLPALDALGRYDRPFLALAGEFDPNLGSQATQDRWIELVPGARGQDHRRYPAGHFIQEDVGAQMAAQVVEFMQANPIPSAGPLFNLRYCEILLLRAASAVPGSVLQAEVYNSLGLNDCPQPLWDALDLNAIATEQDALAAVKNGPRFWVLDRIAPLDNGNTGPIDGFGDTATFGGIDMRLAATVELNSGVSGENEPYVINEVARSTVFTFVAGRRVFELEDPEGGVYVMQSMSRIIEPELQLYELLSLDDLLDLPDGWSFRTRVLQEELELVADGLARVITDDLSNTYQKVE